MHAKSGALEAARHGASRRRDAQFNLRAEKRHFAAAATVACETMKKQTLVPKALMRRTRAAHHRKLELIGAGPLVELRGRGANPRPPALVRADARPGVVAERGPDIKPDVAAAVARSPERLEREAARERPA